MGLVLLLSSATGAREKQRMNRVMEWYYAKHGKQEGPVELAVLQGKLQSGELSSTDLIWRDGMAEWTAAGEVSEVTAAPAATTTATITGTPAVGGDGESPTGTHSLSSPTQAPVSSPGIPVATPTSGLAIASMVCGIVSVILCYVNALAAIPAVICGHMALKQIRNAPVPVGGRGMAIAGLVTGYIGLTFQILMIVFILIAFMGGSF